MYMVYMDKYVHGIHGIHGYLVSIPGILYLDKEQGGVIECAWYTWILSVHTSPSIPG